MSAPRRTSRQTPEYDFDPRLGSTGRYVNRRTGRIVPSQVITDALESQITVARDNIKKVSVSFADGDISLADWQTSMAREMKLIHTQTAALAKGGWDQMTQSDWGAVGALTKFQYKKLEDFAVEISTGKVRLRNLAGEVNGHFIQRAELYGHAAASTHSQMERRQARQNGRVTHEGRELDVRAKHCQCCPAEAAKGPLPIGKNDLKPIGGCTCSTRCRCRFYFGFFLPSGKFQRV